jgi:hypothetical protein
MKLLGESILPPLYVYRSDFEPCGRTIEYWDGVSNSDDLLEKVWLTRPAESRTLTGARIIPSSLTTSSENT